MKGEELEEKTNEITTDIFMEVLKTFPNKRWSNEKKEEMLKGMKAKIREKLEEI